MRRYRTHRHPRRQPARRTRFLITACFMDGPETGVRRRITRDPILLRVAHNGGDITALEKLDAAPEETAILYVYHRTTPRAKRGPVRADYHFYPAQPPDRRARHPYGWPAWVREQLAELRKSN